MFATAFRGRLRLSVAGGCLGLAGVLTIVAGVRTTAAPPSTPTAGQVEATTPIEVDGRTQCLLTRRFVIAPVPLHPVTEVLVEPGARVTKDQKLVKLDDDEPQADVRARQAALDSAAVAVAEARRHLAAVDAMLPTGSLSEQRYHEARAAALKAEADERTAKAALDSAKAELEHYEVTSPIEGVVSWLKVHPGMVSRPGTSVWGEIVDLREIDVRCRLTIAQVERVVVGQAAEVRKKGHGEVFGTGRVVFVGVAADPATDLVPVHVRLANPGERLRCDEPVVVRFAAASASRAE
jgi:RND family efflux transporter MFP subunit